MSETNLPAFPTNLPAFPAKEFAGMETGQVIVADLNAISDEDWDEALIGPVRLALPFLPFAYLGFFNPELMGDINGFIFPGLAALAYSIGVGREFNIHRRMSRNLHQTLGKKPSGETVNTILKTHKSLKKGQTIFLPLSELENHKSDIEIPQRIAKLGVLVNKYTVQLAWDISKNHSTIWDETVNDLIEVYSLRTTAPEKSVMKQLTKNTVPDQSGKSTMGTRFKKFVSSNRFVSIQKIN